MSTHNLKPLSEVVKDLKAEGFKTDFRFNNSKLETIEDHKSFNANELNIIEEYRFEGDSDPGMMTILYAVEATDGTKGTISNAYGANADQDLGEFMNKVKTKN